MAKFDFSKRDSFGSKLGIVAAAAGSAIGLGNIWRFPYVVGENGGAAFILLYVGFIVLIGIPVLLSELTIGRRAQRNAYGSFKLLKPKQPWYLIGLMGVAAAFFILAFYSTVAGWTLEYLYLAIVNGFKGKSTAELQSFFTDFQLSGWKPVIWQIVIMILTAGIILGGIRKGVEKYTKVLMPILLVLIIVMCIRSVTLPGAMEGIRFLFQPDFSKINASTALEALGQAFFSLSIGMGTLITYGSYIQKKDNLSTTAYAVSAADTLIAILAGIAIFPAVFAFGINPSEGEGLVFITLPNIFQQMPGGYFWAVLFFSLLVIAALTSTISVLEVVVAFFTEELNIKRRTATIVSASVITIIGIFCTLSQGPMPELSLFGKSFFGLINFTSASIMLPLGGLLIVIFVGWFMGKKNVKDELSNSGKIKFPLLNFFMVIVRVLAPIAIALDFLNGLGLFKI